MSSNLPPGITLDSAGQVHVDKQVGEQLFDLALALEDAFPQPVDIEHVLAGIILACQEGHLDATASLSADSEDLLKILRASLVQVFAQYGSNLDADPL